MDDKVYRTDLSDLKYQIEKQLSALSTLYNTHLSFLSEPPPIHEAELLRAIHVSAKKISYKVASDTSDIELQIQTCILNILKGIEITENKTQLAQLKMQDRQNMPYNRAHMAGIAIMMIGIGFLIAATIIGVLLSFPASLVLFSPFLAVGLATLTTGGGLIKKGMLDNDKFFTSVWKNGGIEQFISSLTSEKEEVLVKANSLYLLSQPKSQPLDYSNISLQVFPSAPNQLPPTPAESFQLPHSEFL